MEIKVINKKQGKIFIRYINFLLLNAFELTEEKDDGRFSEFHKLIKSVVQQSNLFTEQKEIEEKQLVHEWLFMTPNLLFHTFNGFVAGLGKHDEICSSDLMSATFKVLKSLSDMANKEELKPKFISYVAN